MSYNGFKINLYGDNMTKYQEIVASIKKQIITGNLTQGSKLPSIRKLSEEFQCSKDTVQHALSELRYQKLIYVVAKSGYYVLGGGRDNESISLKIAKNQTSTYEDFKDCLKESLVGRENYLFNYYQHENGLEDLITSLQNLLRDDAIYAKKEQIVVTSGTQQALYILSQMSFPDEKGEILLEQPTYHQMNTIVRSQKLPYRVINRDFRGLDLKKVEQIFSEGNIKFFYTIPRFSNPLQLSYTKEEKQALVTLAAQYDVYLVEDDYMSDFDKSHEMPLHYWDVDERVIYVKSFSSSLFPALRLGAVVLPHILQRSFLSYKRLIDYDTNLIMQKALSLYIDNGMYARTKDSLKAHYENQYSFRKLDTISKAKIKSCPFYYDMMADSYIDTCPNDWIRLQKKNEVEFDRWLTKN